MTTFLATRKTLQQGSSDLATQLAAERYAAREDREQDRRKEAYISLLRYVFWLSDVNHVSRTIIARQHAVLSNLRDDGSASKTGQEAVSARAVFESAGPTRKEQRRLDTGPTVEDNAATYALVVALSSNAVLDAFEELMKCDSKFFSKQVGMGAALLRKPKRAKVDATVDNISDAAQIDNAADVARQTIESVAHLINASNQLMEAGKDFKNAVEKIRKLVRAELQRPERFADAC